MANPVVDDLQGWKDDADAADTNLPISATQMGTGQAGELAGELRRIKSEMKGLEIRVTEKGANIASAATLTLGADGNYFVVTGSVNITAISTRRAGDVIRLHFAATPLITHNAASLILASGANFTPAVSDIMEFVSEGPGNWRERVQKGSQNIPSTDGFPSGTRLIFDADSPPTGWTKDTTTVNDKVIRIVTGARADGGTWTISGLSSASHTHTGPSHTHTGPSHRHVGGGHTHSAPSHTHTTGSYSVGSHTHTVPRDGWGSENPGGLGRLNTDGDDCCTQGVASGNNTSGSTAPGFSGSSGSTGGTTGSGSATTQAAGTGATGAAGTGATGGTASTISSDGTWRPLHRDMIIASKD